MLHKQFILTCACIISWTFAYKDTNLCSPARFSFFFWKSNRLNPTDLYNRRKPSISITTTTEKPYYICAESTSNYECILRDIQLAKNESINFGPSWIANPQKNVAFENSRLAYLPKTLFEAFPQMEMLNAEELQIEGIEDGALSNAANLKVLFLKNNMITNINEFQGVPLLLHLDVSYNKINFIGGNAFQQNKRLNRILMNKNFMSELPKTDTIDNLQILNVANNGINQVSDHQFTKNYNLEYLDVSFNNLNYFNLDQLDDKPFLSFIDVSHNNLKRLYIPMKVDSLKAANNSIEAVTVSNCDLEKLDLSRNQITDATVLQTCSKLKILNLSYNKLQYFDLIDSLSSLSDLNLAYNNLFEITFPRKVHPLKFLDLSNNHLSYGPLNIFKELEKIKINNNKFIEFKFANMRKLNFIRMSNNKWSCSKIEDIMKTGIIADANEVCPVSQSRNGICCRNYKRGYSDRLKEMVRETFIHENVNAQDQEQCKLATPNSLQQKNIQTIHVNTASIDEPSKKIYDEIQKNNIKLFEISDQFSLSYLKKSELSKKLENYKRIVNKLRAHYGVINETLISTIVTLDRVLKFTLERNIKSNDRLERKTTEVQEKDKRLENLNDKITAANIENDKLHEELATLKQKESEARKTKLQLAKEANRNSSSLHDSKG